MQNDNPYAAPPKTDRNPPPPEEAPDRSVWLIWFKCWLGIGVGGTVIGFFLGGSWGLLHIGLRSFLEGLVISGISFAATAAICGVPLTRRASMRASAAAGLLTGLAVSAVPPSVIGTPITSIALTVAAVLPEFHFWDNRDHKRITRMADRFRGVTPTFREVSNDQ